MRLSHLIPDAETLLTLEPEELAGILLEQFNTMSEYDLQRFHRHNFLLDVSTDTGYQEQYRQRVSEAAMEAWIWLEREGLIAPRPGASSPESVFITRRGRAIRDRSGLESFRRARLLPEQILHPLIVQKVSVPFLRGEYDTAIFIAFREIEVAVRAAGGFTATDLGVALMEEAFKPHAGALSDTSEPEPEQLAIRKLFAGAIGYYKNPGSHRNVIIDASEAVELICFASRLMKIIGARTTQQTAQQARPE